MERNEEHATVRGDLEWGTIPAMIQSSAERFGDAEAIVDGDVRITFAELAGRVDDAARAFLAAGLDRGDRASVWAPNTYEWVIAAAGLQAAGGVLVPLNTRFKGHEAGYVLEKAQCRFLFTVTDFLDTDYVALLRSAMGGAAGDRPVADLPKLEKIVVLRGSAPEGCVAWTDFLRSGQSVSDADVAARRSAIRPADLSDILFTSGTTGNPKGVLQTHGNGLRAFRDWSEVVGLREGDRYLIVNPFFHAFGYKAGWLSCLMMGATILPHPVFDVPAVLARVSEESISVLPGPPTLYQSILAHPDLSTFDLSNLRLSVTGAAVIPVELIHRMRRELNFETIITGYGLTETCGIATMCRYDDDPETIATTSGRAIPGVEVEIHDDAGVSQPPKTPGEVVIRGYNVMSAYLDEPDETSATIDEKGWLHTGDIGLLDERGYIQITDRKKDMFIMGGFNAYPAEIENGMAAHPDIVQVAVIGVPDDRMGEVGMAFVVLREGARLTPDELVAFCRERMANYKVPRHVRFVDALPLNATGKVQKFLLREQANKERADDA